jgi:hypothetical protein
MSNCEDLGTQTLFHATNKTAGTQILQSGKMLPGRAGMFGAAIYFAGSVQEAQRRSRSWNQNNGIVIKAQVRLGRALVLSAPSNGLTLEKIRAVGAETVKGRSSDRAIWEYAVFESERVTVLGGPSAYPRPPPDYPRAPPDYPHAPPEDSNPPNYAPEYAVPPYAAQYAVPPYAAQYAVPPYAAQYAVPTPSLSMLPMSNCEDLGTQILFHATNKTAGTQILQSGRMLPGTAGMFGAAIYFAGSVQEAQRISRYWSHNNGIVIKAQVRLGRALVLSAPSNDLTLEKITAVGAETVKGRSSPRGTWQYVVFESERVTVLGGLSADHRPPPDSPYSDQEDSDPPNYAPEYAVPPYAAQSAVSTPSLPMLPMPPWYGPSLVWVGHGPPRW